MKSRIVTRSESMSLRSADRSASSRPFHWPMLKIAPITTAAALKTPIHSKGLVYQSLMT